MLKINLLPGYIFEKRKVRRAMIVSVILVLGVVAGMFGWFTKLSTDERNLNMEVATLEQQKQDVEAIGARASAEEAKAPPIESKVKYIEDIMAYNTEYPKLYGEVARYTYSRILYKSIEPSGSSLRISARARSVGDCGRYLLNMYRASHIFTSVTIDSVPGWDGDITEGFDFNVTCNLVKSIAAPTFGATADPNAGGGMPQPM